MEKSMDTKQNDKKPAPRPTGQDAPKRPEDTTSSGDARNGGGEDNHVQKKQK
jgi:hypothetical protein